MQRFLFLFFVSIFLPIAAIASPAADFTVNPQSTYDVPYGVTQILILDLTLPAPLAGETYQVQSITVDNVGTAENTLFTKIEVWEEDAIAGWNGSERDAAKLTFAPFFGGRITGDFRAYTKDDPWRRIFVTVDLASGYVGEKTIKPELKINSVVILPNSATGPSDEAVIGLERKIVHSASQPTAPISPIAAIPEALSDTAIRWHFTDLSNNEFGFKILDSNLKEVARSEAKNVTFIDETGLQPDTEYSGRLVVAFNDRGTSLTTALSNFTAVRTLAASEEATEVRPPREKQAEAIEPQIPVTAEALKQQIQTLQLQLIDLLKQLAQILQEQIVTAQASVFSSFSTFTFWLESFF